MSEDEVISPIGGEQKYKMNEIIDDKTISMTPVHERIYYPPIKSRLTDADAGVLKTMIFELAKFHDKECSDELISHYPSFTRILAFIDELNI